MKQAPRQTPKPAPAKPSTLKFAFGKRNYIILAAGILVVMLGFILMSGGGSADPTQFNADELFSTRRITVAPILVLIGYIIIGYAIMYKPKQNVVTTVAQ
ncbi:MAG: DUF3098 domain-containing protein [Flavobacteriales bacterium]